MDNLQYLELLKAYSKTIQNQFFSTYFDSILVPFMIIWAEFSLNFRKCVNKPPNKSFLSRKHHFTLLIVRKQLGVAKAYYYPSELHCKGELVVRQSFSCSRESRRNRWPTFPPPCSSRSVFLLLLFCKRTKCSCFTTLPTAQAFPRNIIVDQKTWPPPMWSMIITQKLGQFCLLLYQSAITSRKWRSNFPKSPSRKFCILLDCME